jgi:NTE family protein
MTDLPLPDSPAADAASSNLEDILGLALSGGGYRAMVFHAGVLWYLNDAGYLPKLDRISSVSGGSITAGVLATRWNQLKATFDASGRSPQFGAIVVNAIRTMAGTTIDAGSIITGALLPGTTVGERIARSYRKVLFGDRTLQDLPDHPRFFITAANVQTGSLFRFSKKYIADYRVGQIVRPKVGVAEAVASSSAFPPVLSPMTLRFKHSDWSGLETEVCGVEPFTTKVVLTDAGVYDNLGLEPVFKRCRRLLVSDAGGRYQAEPDPHRDPVRHTTRVLATIDNQVRSLRKRQLVGAFRDKSREGAYWGTWAKPSEYPVHAPSLPIDNKRADELARTPTRLQKMSPELQNRLINFGYGMAERAIRSYFDPGAFVPTAFPCPGGV